MTVLVFVAFFEKTKNPEWLLGSGAYLTLLLSVVDVGLLKSGYADVPSSFFALAAYFAFYSFAFSGKEKSDLECLVAIALGSAAMETKQSGMFIFIVIFVVCAMVLFRWRRDLPRNTWLLAVLTSVVGNLPYLALGWNVLIGRESAYTVTVSRVVPNAGGYIDRWISAFNLLRFLRGADSGWFIVAVFILMLLGGLQREYRLLLFAIAAPFYIIWALFFSYESRTLALFIPFAAACAASGSLTLFDSIEAALGRKFWPRWRTSRATLVAGLCVLGATGIAASFFGLGRGQGIFTEQSAWFRAVRFLGPWFFVAVVLVLGVGTLGRGRGLKLSVSASSTIILLMLVLAVLHFSVLTPVRIEAMQVEAQKTVGLPDLNYALYNLQRIGRLQGMIASDYFFLGHLPELRDYYLESGFPPEIGVADIQQIVAKPSVAYLLLNDSKLPPGTRKWLLSHHFSTVVDESGYRLIEVPSDARLGR